MTVILALEHCVMVAFVHTPVVCKFLLGPFLVLWMTLDTGNIVGTVMELVGWKVMRIDDSAFLVLQRSAVLRLCWKISLDVTS